MDVRTARELRGWTQTKLADEAGLNKGTVSRIEAGEIPNPSNATAAALEAALGVKRGTLVFGVQGEARAS